MKKLLSFIALSLFILSVSYADSVILSEDFESVSSSTTETAPNGWSTDKTSGDGWKFGSDLSSSYWSIPEHTKYAADNALNNTDQGDEKNVFLKSPVIDLRGHSNIALKFDSYYTGGYSQRAWIVVSTDSGHTWSTIKTLSSFSKWKTEYVSLANYSNDSAVVVAFKTDDGGSYGSGWAVDNIVIYEAPSYDVGITTISNQTYLKHGDITLKGIIQNSGIKNLTKYRLSWTVDNGTTVYTDTFSLSLPFGSTYAFSHDTKIPMDVVKSYPLKCWVSFPSDSIDGDNTNDTLSKTLVSLSNIPQKVVVGEEAGGTWCPWCPRGLVALKDMEHYYSDTWVGISVHNGDPMVNSYYDNALASHLAKVSYPNGFIDRSAKYGDVDPDNFKTDYLDRVKIHSPVSVSISNIQWDVPNLEITFTVNATFYSNFDGDFRINAVVKENNVTGTSSGYDQRNYYGVYGYDLIDWEGNNWKDKPFTVPASEMVYDHVARSILGGWDGTESSIPSTVSDSATYSYTYSYTVDTSKYDEMNLYLVGMVIDQNTGEILNGTEEKMIPVNIPTAAMNSIKFYPNPTTGRIFVTNADNAKIEVWSVFGQRLKTISNSTRYEVLDLSNFSEGTYIVKVYTKNQILTKRVLLVK
jgi:hypothetical protein